MNYQIKSNEIKNNGLNRIYNFNQYAGEDDTPMETINPSIEDSEDDFEKLCESYPKLPHILPAKKRIICIGDLHGDYKLTLNCLKVAKVINDKNEWIAKPPDTIVVQIGDQIDKCRPTPNQQCTDPTTTPQDEDSDIKILEFFTSLNEKAIKKGGAVISLLGNHEIMNVQGNMNYVSHKGLKHFDNTINPDTKKKFRNGLEARKYFFKKGQKYANFLACTRQTALIVGSNVFVHATILPELAKKFKVKDLNTLVRKWLLDMIDDDSKVEGICKIGDILYNYHFSPFWPRVLGNLPPNVPLSDDVCIDNLMETLELYNVNNMIVGHTPQIFLKDKAGINVTCRDEVDGINKGIWRIDVGSSSGFNNFKNKKDKEISKPQVLEILNDNEFNVLS